MYRAGQSGFKETLISQSRTTAMLGDEPFVNRKDELTQEPDRLHAHFESSLRRAGLLSALVFLDLNGLVISDPERLLYRAMIDIAERTTDKSGLADQLRRLSKP
jgi:hypothetical protein